MNKSTYVVYILKCANGNYYTGITNNLEDRLKKHQSGKGAKYTRANGPCTLAYSESQPDKSSALKREIEIKSWDRKRKIAELGLN